MKTHLLKGKLLVPITGPVFRLRDQCTTASRQQRRRWCATPAADARRSADHDGPVQEWPALLHPHDEETGKESGAALSGEGRLYS